jgi:uncharacterized protein (TIGR02594 family)
MLRFAIAVAAGLCLVTTAQARQHHHLARESRYSTPISTAFFYSGPPVEDAWRRCDEVNGCVWKEQPRPIRAAWPPATSADEAPMPETVGDLPRQIEATTLDVVSRIDSGTSELIARARRYLGTNPTGWRHVWCGRFMAMIAPGAAHRIGNPNLARNWARLPHTGPQVGAIAVLTRRGGGHVGVVAGFSGRNPVLISGNHGDRVGVGVYPAQRVIAYVRGYP